MICPYTGRSTVLRSPQAAGRSLYIPTGTVPVEYSVQNINVGTVGTVLVPVTITITRIRNTCTVLYSTRTGIRYTQLPKINYLYPSLCTSIVERCFGALYFYRCSLRGVLTIFFPQQGEFATT
jgi:hypothetical protein